MRAKLRWAVPAIVMFGLAATTFSGAAATAGTTGVRYMIGAGYVKDIVRDPAASRALDGTQPIINIQTVRTPEGSPARFPSRPPSDVPASWNAIYMYRWASETQMALDMPGVPSWITMCMYDNEDADQYPMTPQNERDDPASFYPKAADICHKAGKLFIPSSGIRQMKRQNQSENDSVYATATSWDGYSMQTQAAENDVARFTANVENFQRRILAVNPRTKIFIVGVGDFAGGHLQPPSTVETAIKSLPPGMIYWMNYGPHNGKGCRDPSECPIPARPDLLVQVIKDLAAH